MESGETPALGAVIAARAAHELRHFDKRDAYLTRAAKLAPHDTALRVITQAEILLENRRYQEAINVLKELSEKHTAALRLELKAQQQARNWERSLQLLDQLQRRGGMDAPQAEQLRRLSYAESLKRQSFDEQALEASWQKIPTHLKPDARIAAAAARHFMTLGLPLRARQIIEQALAAQWDSELISLYGECAGPDVIRQIERAEQWLTVNSQDAVLLRTLGKLCAQQGLWGKAQTYLEASISVEPSAIAHLALAELFERLDNGEAARNHYRASLDLALAQLRETTGGRRKAVS
jgi:HemY protein